MQEGEAPELGGVLQRARQVLRGGDARLGRQAGRLAQDVKQEAQLAGNASGVRAQVLLQAAAQRLQEKQELHRRVEKASGANRLQSRVRRPVVVRKVRLKRVSRGRPRHRHPERSSRHQRRIIRAAAAAATIVVIPQPACQHGLQVQR